MEVRADTGKFVKTAWERTVAGVTWRLVLGFNDTVQTVIDVNADAPLRSAPPPREFYELVERVNADLMASEPGGA